jgi:hypothetical protein
MAGDAVPASETNDSFRRYGTIIVVGGGCYGSYYVQQLRRARERQAIAFAQIVVVDRDPACAVAVAAACEAVTDVRIVNSDWADWFADYLDGDASRHDAVVPSPLMPHLFLQWVERRARERWPDRAIEIRTPAPIDGIPWQQASAGGPRYVSFAEWMCPINCIEPKRCPHTRGERTWSLADSLRKPGVAILACTHRAYGVGMIDVGEILDADRAMAAAVDAVGEHGAAELLVGTVSHCHGALGIVAVGSAGARSPASMATNPAPKG